jgi:ATP phosphoribosyltransferase regulatory subunit
MTDFASRALLPAGFADLLPPEAGFEAATVERLMSAFAAQGYVRVKPPLLEFEESLLGGEPRPLRLCYAGQVVRVTGDALRSARQFGQIGCELIGSASVAADVEAVQLAASSLADIGARGLSVDLSSPTLVGAIIEGTGLAGDQAALLRNALDRKDAAAVATHGGEAAAMLGLLLRESGDAARALAALRTAGLPPRATEDARRLEEVVATLGARRPDLAVTVDLVENRGFEYHTGLCFTLFARGVRGELGRGGRYLAGGDFAAGGGEAATGFTLYTDTILRALPAPAPARSVFVPMDAPASTGEALRAGGWATLAALEAHDDTIAEARRLGCSHAWIAGKIHTLGE